MIGQRALVLLNALGQSGPEFGLVAVDNSRPALSLVPSQATTEAGPLLSGRVVCAKEPVASPVISVLEMSAEAFNRRDLFDQAVSLAEEPQ